MRHKSQPSGARLLVPSHYKVHHREGAFSMKTLRLELMIYAVGSWVVRYTLALREFLMLGKPMFAAGRLPFFCLLSLEIIDTCFPPRASWTLQISEHFVPSVLLLSVYFM